MQWEDALASKGLDVPSNCEPSHLLPGLSNSGWLIRGIAGVRKIDRLLMPVFFVLTLLGTTRDAVPQENQAAVIRGVDAAVLARVNRIAKYTVTEHYAVYRGKDETHPVAEMTVKTTYQRGTGKSYSVVSQSGSALVRRLGLDPLLENERTINLPGNVEHSWINSANYDMKLKPGTQMLEGRECLALAIDPKRKAPNLIVGSLWVDAKDYSIAQLDGVASKAPSIFAGTTHMMREYAYVDGFSMATHARAESNTFLYGRTVVTIDYSDYQIQVRPGS